MKDPTKYRNKLPLSYEMFLESLIFLFTLIEFFDTKFSIL